MGELRYYCSSLGVENVQTSISPLTNLVQPCSLLFTLSTTSVFTKIRPLDLSLCPQTIEVAKKDAKERGSQIWKEWPNPSKPTKVFTKFCQFLKSLEVFGH